jgi:excisionase family DNA binding protein
MSASPSHPIATLSKSLNESELPFEIKDAAIPPILNLAEAAKLVRCSRAHLCNVINGKVRGIPQLPTVRIGRRVLFRRESLEQWLRELEATGRKRAAS